jgi:hypothetical protein
MAMDASAYAILGLEPDADAGAVDQAYKRLIKQYHPDRQGGDAGRAAEINRAYRELRRGATKDPLKFNEDVFGKRGSGLRWPLAALAIAAAVGSLVLVTGPVARLIPQAAPHLPLGHVAPAAVAADPMDQPLHLAAIDFAARQALRISRTRDEMALAQATSDCQREFQRNPGLKLLDRCAAFDDAVVELQDRDPLRDQGPFAPLQVTGRQWSAASGLSNDYLAIDSRLDQIRLRVELALAPLIAPVAPPTEVQRVADAKAGPPPCGEEDGTEDLPNGC